MIPLIWPLAASCSLCDVALYQDDGVRSVVVVDATWRNMADSAGFPMMAREMLYVGRMSGLRCAVVARLVP